MMMVNDRLPAHGLPECARRSEVDAGDVHPRRGCDRPARFRVVDRKGAGDGARREFPAVAPEVLFRARFRARLRHRPRPIDNADPRRERMQYAPEQFLYFTQPG